MSTTNGGPPEPGRARFDEPVRKPWLWVGLGVIILLGIPWYLPASTIEPIVAGMPLWTLIAVASSVLVAAYLTWMLSRHWNVVEDYEEATGESIGPDSPIDEIEGRF